MRCLKTDRLFICRICKEKGLLSGKAGHQEYFGVSGAGIGRKISDMQYMKGRYSASIIYGNISRKKAIRGWLSGEVPAGMSCLI